MQLKEIIEKLSLEVLCCKNLPAQEVSGGYTGDLLSDVIAHTARGNIWVTMQVHLNIVAVARMQDLAAIILINNRLPAPDVVEKAEQEHIPVCRSTLPAFELVGKLYAMGIKGAKQEYD